MEPPYDPVWDEMPEDFASMVRSLRARMLWTQEELAERSGVSVGTIAGIESGRVRRPRDDTLRRLAAALDLSEPQRAAFAGTARREPAAGESVEATATGGAAPATSYPPHQRLVVPGQLPSAVPGFVGRADVLNSLDDLATGAEQPTAVVISAVSGTAGVGKTALAVHWAHRVREQFPDGQLYVNLRGFDPSGAVMEPADAMHGFLDALGVAPQRIPVDLDAQAALYRSLLSDKRMLVVLDNARDTNQVRPLLPGSPGSLVVVTSRNALTGLVAKEGAHPLNLDLLTTAEAHELLVSRLGRDRVAAEPNATNDIIGLCARLPLALAVVASRAAAHPRFPLRTLAMELRGTCLDAFADSDQSIDVRAVFSWSYQQLTPQARRLFRLLALHPGPDISASAAASLAALGPADVRPLLTELAGCHLITERQPSRYNFHDLLRTYARELTERTDTQADRQDGIRRMLDHYVHAAFAGDRLLYPQRDQISLASPVQGVTAEPLGGGDQAMAWFTAERAVLLAALHVGAGAGLDVQTWQLAWGATTFLQRQGHWRDEVSAWRLAVTATQQLGDAAAQAVAHRHLARTYRRLGHLSDAHEQLQLSLDLSSGLGDSIDQAHTYNTLAMLLAQGGDYAGALGHAQRALELYQGFDHQSGVATGYNSISVYYTQLGDHEQALVWGEHALASFQQLSDRDGEAAAWDTVGYAHHHLGNHQTALSCCLHALELYRQLRDRYHEAEILTHLGDAHNALGDQAATQDAWQQALEILDHLDHPEADALRAKLKALEHSDPVRDATGR